MSKKIESKLILYAENADKLIRLRFLDDNVYRVNEFFFFLLSPVSFVYFNLFMNPVVGETGASCIQEKVDTLQLFNYMLT